jgi:hypothetical protein
MDEIGGSRTGLASSDAVPRIVAAVTLVIAVAALAVAGAALREARQSTEPPTYAEVTAAAVR